MDMNNTHTFQVGTSYSTGRADYEWTFTVVARTAKFITICDEWGKTTRVGAVVFEGREIARPLGTYSLCPVISADEPVAA